MCTLFGKPADVEEPLGDRQHVARMTPLYEFRRRVPVQLLLEGPSDFDKRNRKCGNTDTMYSRIQPFWRRHQHSFFVEQALS